MKHNGFKPVKGIGPAVAEVEVPELRTENSAICFTMNNLCISDILDILMMGQGDIC